MAEVIGLAASIIQIAGAGTKLSLALYNFTSSAARADQDIRDIANDVELTSNALESVGRVFEMEDAKSIVSKKAVQDANNIIKKCEDVFKELEEIIEKRRKFGKDGKKSLSMMGKLSWPMKEQRVELNRRRLESLKNSLVLLLHVLQLAQGQTRGQVHASIVKSNALTDCYSRMEKSVMDEEREKIRQLHQTQQESLRSLQALKNKFCKVVLDDEETLQGSTTTSRVPTIEFMHNPLPASMPPLEKATSRASTNTITIDLSTTNDSDTSDSDATITDDDDEHLSIEELAKCAKHAQKLLKRIALLQQSFESSQKTGPHRKKRIHKLYQRFCRKFESDIIFTSRIRLPTTTDTTKPSPHSSPATPHDTFDPMHSPGVNLKQGLSRQSSHQIAFTRNPRAPVSHHLAERSYRHKRRPPVLDKTLHEDDDLCAHETEYGGLCVDCGKDMTEDDYSMKKQNLSNEDAIAEPIPKGTIARTLPKSITTLGGQQNGVTAEQAAAKDIQKSLDKLKMPAQIQQTILQEPLVQNPRLPAVLTPFAPDQPLRNSRLPPTPMPFIPDQQVQIPRTPTFTPFVTQDEEQNEQKVELARNQTVPRDLNTAPLRRQTQAQSQDHSPPDSASSLINGQIARARQLGGPFPLTPHPGQAGMSNFRLPPDSQKPNFKSAPATPSRTDRLTISLAQERGLKLPGGLPGAASSVSTPASLMTLRPRQIDSNLTAYMRESQPSGTTGMTKSLTDLVRLDMMPADLDPAVKQQLLRAPEQQFRAILQHYTVNASRTTAGERALIRSFFDKSELSGPVSNLNLRSAGFSSPASDSNWAGLGSPGILQSSFDPQQSTRTENQSGDLPTTPSFIVVCGTCQARKLDCGGGEPCSRCTTDNVECSYRKSSASPMIKRKDATGRKRIGRRRGPLRPAQREHTQGMRNPKSCSTCRELKRTCKRAACPNHIESQAEQRSLPSEDSRGTNMAAKVDLSADYWGEVDPLSVSGGVHTYLNTSFTPLVSPANTPAEEKFESNFTLPWVLFSPLTSPVLRAQTDSQDPIVDSMTQVSPHTPHAVKRPQDIAAAVQYTANTLPVGYPRPQNPEDSLQQGHVPRSSASFSNFEEIQFPMYSAPPEPGNDLETKHSNMDESSISQVPRVRRSGEVLAEAYSQGPGYSSDLSSYAIPMPGLGETENMFAHPPYSSNLKRTRTSLNDLNSEACVYPNRGPQDVMWSGCRDADCGEEDAGERGSKRQKMTHEKEDNLLDSEMVQAGDERDIVDILLEQWTVPVY